MNASSVTTYIPIAIENKNEFTRRIFEKFDREISSLDFFTIYIIKICCENVKANNFLNKNSHQNRFLFCQCAYFAFSMFD